MTFSDPIPFTEALEKLRSRGVLPSGLDSFSWSRMPVALRERAFFSSRLESARVLQAMQDYLGDYLANDRAIESHGGLRATGRAEFVANMRELAIREGLGRVDPQTGEISPEIRESDLRDIRSLARLQLIFDTQVEAAQEYGYWKQGQDPDILEVFPAQRFIRVRPVMAPRPYHEAALGEVRRKDDLQFWLSLNRDFGVPWGPWGFNSGCGVEDVDRDEAVELGVMREADEVRPVEREFNEGLEASIRDLGPDLAAALRRATGGTAAGGRLKAGGGAAAPPPESTSVDEALAIAGIQVDAEITEAQASALIAELKEDSPRPARAKIKSIKGAQRQGQLKKAWIERTMQDFVDFLPPDLVDMLPEIDIEVRRGIPRAAGDYNKIRRKLRLASSRLQDPARARKTLMHELLHWVHDHGPVGYADQVKALFHSRTAGEPMVILRPYNLSSIRGRRDKWADADGDEYAGRIYSWETADPKGTEVVTHHLEKLADPALLRKHWNHAAPDGTHPWRDACLQLLEILYWRP